MSHLAGNITSLPSFDRQVDEIIAIVDRHNWLASEETTRKLAEFAKVKAWEDFEDAVLDWCDEQTTCPECGGEGEGSYGRAESDDAELMTCEKCKGTGRA